MIARRHRLALALPAVILLGLTLGIARGYRANSFSAELTNRFGQKTTITGRLYDDPAATDRGFISYRLDQVQIEGRGVRGRVAVTGPFAKLRRGWRVSVTGRLRPGFGSNTASLFSPAEILSDDAGWLENLRQRFMAGTRTALPEPLASFGLGLLLGTRSAMPDWLNEVMIAAGLSHLVAVSGYNLTIIVNAAARPLRRWSRNLATLLPLWLILGFCLMTGFTASVVRAAVVSVLSLLGWHYGRTIKPLVLIGLAAAGTAAVNPPYLWQDLGWQLSFLAFFGILVVAPALAQRFLRKPNAFQHLMLETLSAQAMTLPLIMLIFGRLSLVAPLANALVLPAVPFAMLATFVAGLAGLLLPAFSGWLAWPALALLHLMLEVAKGLVGIPHAQSHLQLAAPAALALYGAAAIWLALVRRSTRIQAGDV